MPDVLIGQDSTGRALTASDLCTKRPMALRQLVLANPRVRPHLVTVELSSQPPAREREGDREPSSWEGKAVVIIAFSNHRPENR
jgi:hypothetical protein